MAQEKPSIPTVVYEGVSSTLSRWWSGISQRFRSDNEDDTVYENSYADIPLRGILKKKGSFKQKRPQLRASSFADVVKAAVQINNVNRSRRARNAVPNRKGPLPTQELPLSQRGEVKSTFASLNTDSFCNDEGDTSENVLPSNRGLLTYFQRMAQSSNEEDKVDLIFIESLLTAGADINVGDKYNQTIMHAIVKDWHPDIVKYAISRGADINRADRYGRTPLHVAAAANYPEMIEYLINEGAILDAKTEREDQTAIHYAAKNDAVESIKCLIKYGAKISDRDYKGRTPLFLAAESGREEAVAYLLDFGAGAATYDTNGNCAIALLADKMPELAYKALNQFVSEDKASRKARYYLASLEFDVTCKMGRTPARTILETIVYKKDISLVQHPVIQKLIAVKWRKFAGFRATVDIIVNIIYACVLTSLTAIQKPKSLYTPLKTHGWRIGVEALFVLMTFYLVFAQIKAAKRSKQRHHLWQKWRIQCMSRDLKNCHPQWREERRYLKKEMNRVLNMKVTYFRNGWNWYEWISFFGAFNVMVVQLIYVLTKKDNIYMWLRVTYAYVLALVWLRLLKPFRTIPLVSALIVMLSDIIKGSAQFCIVFLAFFVPLVTSGYVMFGGSVNAAIMKKASISDSSIVSYTSVKLVYTILAMVLSGSFSTEPFQAVDRKMANFYFSITLAILNILCLNLFIALISLLFTRMYENAQAQALLQRAECMMQSERNLSMKASNLVKKYIRKNCGPLEQYEMNSKKTENGELLSEVVENVTRNLTTIGLSMKAMNNENENKSQVTVEYNLRKINRNIEDTYAIFEKAEEIFREQWVLIEENQKEIAELLATKEVQDYLKRRIAAKTNNKEKARTLTGLSRRRAGSIRSNRSLSRSGSFRSSTTSINSRQ